MNKKTTGLIAAPPTGFREDGSVDLEVVAPLASHLHSQGTAGVFVNGTTGEGMSLTIEEREALAQAWRKALPAGMTLFVHAGCHSLPDACRLASHAQAIGADAVGALAPGFFRPEGIPGVVDWCARIAGACPDLPFYFYHMPSMNGVHLQILSLLEAVAPRIPNFAGVKFTYEAMGDFQLCLRQDGGRFDMLWGRDEMLLGALATGARGAVGSTYNFACPLYLRLIEAFRGGDLDGARRLQAESCVLINAMIATGNLFAALKHILRAQGVPISTAMRAPLPAADPGSLAALPVP